ncbi:MAG: phosphoethanolamine transferase [Paludibacteraceae bacterium]|nr:phosphoethanolamine transferase [Paludibacteraceae bacterium]
MIDWKKIGQKVWYWFIYPVRTNPVFFVFTMVASTMVMITYNLTPDAGHTDEFLAILLPLLDCYLFTVLAALLRPIWLHWLSWVSFTVITLGEIFSTLCYQSLYTVNVLKLVMQTDAQESSEFVSAVLHTYSPWLSFAIMIASWGVAWGIVYGCRKLKHQPKQIILYVLGALIVWSATREVPQYICLCRSFASDSTADLADSDHLPDLRSSSVRLLYGFAFNYVTAKEMTLLYESVANSQVNACSFRCPTIVLIIGESYNKYHTPLYQPDYIPTTPNMCRMRDKGNLFVHRDAVSPSNLTSNVMHHLFSTWDNMSDTHYTEHTLFPALFRKAGYKVYLYSNQYVLGSTDFWSSIGGTVLNNPQLSALQFDVRNERRYQYDGELLEHLPSADSLCAVPSLLIVHLYGQHVDYDERYPASFERFTADDVDMPFGPHAHTITARYANATLYNDSVIDALWQRLADREVIGIYISDHGEEVYDYRKYYERSDMSELNPQVAHYQFEIPMFFMMTDTFQSVHPDVAESVRRCLNKPFYSADLCHLLLSLAGIDTPEYMPERDLLSPQYDTSRPRLIGRGQDYDQLIQQLQ